MDGRLPAHIEASALIRRVNAAGGFATVLLKGEADAGTILIILTHAHESARLYERMPSLSGAREWTCTRLGDPENINEFNDYVASRHARDPDVWVIELDVADGERFIL